MKAELALLIGCLAVAATRSAYQVPAGSEVITSQILTGFSCLGRPYGYYADVANNCHLFHVCYPVNDESGNIIEEAHFTFICGNQTVFSQDVLTCTHYDAAFPCDQAESLYDISNANFGKIPEILV
ncbi:hypothetical protein SK128_008776 [Halocaridina rubra]|uniref:Chitin-binding type-2 domain-containing protein n=1 Tax=Halocaridina rubra TaxID=373956 RepID=A0AAN8WP73_HALRR